MAILSALEKFMMKQAPRAKTVAGALGQAAKGAGKAIGAEVESSPKLASLLAALGGGAAGASLAGHGDEPEDEDERLRELLQGEEGY